MARRGSSFGFVVLIVAVAIVLFIAQKAWQEVAGRSGVVELPGQPRPSTPAAGTAETGLLPDLHDMRRETSAHAEKLREAAAAIE